MTRLFDAFRRARVGERDEGAVFIDGSKVYRHWMEPDDTVNLESTGLEDVAFVDQDVQFDDRGACNATDTNEQSRQVRILVMVPHNSKLQTLDLVSPPEREGD